MASRNALPIKSPAYRAGSFALVLALGVILAAHGFERFGGLAPCPLCLTQRYAYYAAIPALFAALVLASTGWSRVAGLLFFAVAMGFLTNAGLGGYHAGVEWKFWPGPDTCSGALQPLKPAVGDLIRSIEETRVVRCDEAGWRLAGLSLAGWNVVASLVGFAASLQAAFASASR